VKNARRSKCSSGKKRQPAAPVLPPHCLGNGGSCPRRPWCGTQLIPSFRRKKVRMRDIPQNNMRSSLLRKVALSCLPHTNDRKYQTCLIFVVYDTSDKNPEYFPSTLLYSINLNDFFSLKTSKKCRNMKKQKCFPSKMLA
jgi:hypothetical protein